MAKAKLELNSLTDQEVVTLAKLVNKSLTDNPAFPGIEPAPAVVAADADAITALIGQRQAVLNTAQTLTLAIRDRRVITEANLNATASAVETVANASTDPEKTPEMLIRSAGFATAEIGTPVGEMPKVEGLFATQGDQDGEIDLTWNPIKRGLKSYVIEQSDEGAQAGFRMVKVETRSRSSLAGLTSGKRYWFRVAAVGTAGQGASSEAATKVAP